MFRRPLLISAMAVASISTQAEEAPKPWALTAELGAIQTTGNTNTATVKAKVDASYTSGSWVNKFLADILYKEDELEDATTGDKVKEKTAEKYFLSYQLDYKLDGDQSYIYGLGSYTDDKFGGIAENKTVSAGYGMLIIDNAKYTLDADFGPGYTWINNQSGENTESPILYVAAAFKWQVTQFSEFTLASSVEPSFKGEKNVRTKGNIGFSSRIHDSLQMKLGYSLENNSKVDEEFEKLDTETSVTLVYTV